MIRAKKKYCKGIGKAKDFGCGEEKYLFRYGLCQKCYQNWLYNSEPGKELINKSMLRAKKMVVFEKKKETIEIKKTLLTHSQLEKILQSIINSIVRLTDFDRGCISCSHGWNEPFTRQRHAGHRYSVGSNHSLRFDAFNVFQQCSICNNYLSGNERNFDLGIIKHHSPEYIDILKSHELKYQYLKLSIPELNEAIKKSTEVKKELIKGKYFDREQINKMIGIYK
jgi:hypothetical protein